MDPLRDARVTFISASMAYRRKGMRQTQFGVAHCHPDAFLAEIESQNGSSFALPAGRYLSNQPSPRLISAKLQERGQNVLFAITPNRISGVAHFIRQTREIDA